MLLIGIESGLAGESQHDESDVEAVIDDGTRAGDGCADAEALDF